MPPTLSTARFGSGVSSAHDSSSRGWGPSGRKPAAPPGKQVSYRGSSMFVPRGQELKYAQQQFKGPDAPTRRLGPRGQASYEQRYQQEVSQASMAFGLRGGEAGKFKSYAEGRKPDVAVQKSLPVKTISAAQDKGYLGTLKESAKTSKYQRFRVGYSLKGGLTLEKPEQFRGEPAKYVEKETMYMAITGGKGYPIYKAAEYLTTPFRKKVSHIPITKTQYGKTTVSPEYLKASVRERAMTLGTKREVLAIGSGVAAGVLGKFAPRAIAKVRPIKTRTISYAEEVIKTPKQSVFQVKGVTEVKTGLVKKQVSYVKTTGGVVVKPTKTSATYVAKYTPEKGAQVMETGVIKPTGIKGFFKSGSVGKFLGKAKTKFYGRLGIQKQVMAVPKEGKYAFAGVEKTYLKPRPRGKPIGVGKDISYVKLMTPKPTGLASGEGIATRAVSKLKPAVKGQEVGSITSKGISQVVKKSVRTSLVSKAKPIEPTGFFRPTGLATAPKAETREVTRIGTKVKTKTKVAPRERLRFRTTTVTKAAPKTKVTPALRPAIKAKSRMGFAGKTDMSYRERQLGELITSKHATTPITPFKPAKTGMPPYLPPMAPFIKLPGFKRGGKKAVKKGKRKYRYTPSVYSIAYKVRGKKPKRVTGIELRPLIGR